MYLKSHGRFPYRGLQSWGLLCACSFIVSQALWHLAQYFRHYDPIEIPLSILYFPLALFIDPRDGMLRRSELFPYALSYWLFLFYVSFLISRQRINPAVPAAFILFLSSVASVIYAMFFVYRGPIE
jgi:hypothetical protein